MTRSIDPQVVAYSRMVLDRAVRQSLVILGWHGAGPAARRIFILFVAISVLIIAGILGVTWIHSMVGGMLIIVGLAICPAIVLWQAVVAASSIEQELREELERLKSRVAGFDPGVAQGLENLSTQGNDLIACHPRQTTGSETRQWQQNVLAWCSQVQKFVSANLPRAEAVGLSGISSSPNETLSVAQLGEILRKRHGKLLEITTRYLLNAPKGP